LSSINSRVAFDIRFEWQSCAYLGFPSALAFFFTSQVDL
jgi:hypothetical protein